MTLAKSLRPDHWIMLVFFLQPIAYGSWLPRIPAIQEALGLGPADLALALLGAPIGILATLPFAGRLIARLGGRTAILSGFVAFLGLVAGPAFAASPVMLFVALVIVGITLSLLELGLNVEADRIEALSGRLIMNTAHGFWSLGLMTGSLLGTGLAAIPLAPHWSVALVAAALLPPSLFAARALPRTPGSGSGAPETGRSPFLIRPSRRLAGICLFIVGIAMTEGAAADWAAIYMRDAVQAPGAAAGLAFSIFAGMVAAGRFLGDSLKRRLGAVVLARTAVGLSAAGAVLLLLAPGLAPTLAGFAAAGFGVSVGFPLAVSAAAGLGDRPPAANVALLSLSALTSFLIGPPLIGGVAEHAGIGIGFAMILPALFVSFAFAGSLGRRDAPGALG